MNCTGPCNQGRTPCPTPEACELACPVCHGLGYDSSGQHCECYEEKVVGLFWRDVRMIVMVVAVAAGVLAMVLPT